MEEPWALKGNLGLERNQGNWTKNGMNSILNSLYNPHEDIQFPAPSLWFFITWPVQLWFGVSLNSYYRCLLYGSFDGAYLVSSKRLCLWLSAHLRPKVSVFWTFHFLSWSPWSVSCELWEGYLLACLRHAQTRIHFRGDQLCAPGQMPYLLMN